MTWEYIECEAGCDFCGEHKTTFWYLPKDTWRHAMWMCVDCAGELGAAMLAGGKWGEWDEGGKQ